MIETRQRHKRDVITPDKLRAKRLCAEDFVRKISSRRFGHSHCFLCGRRLNSKNRTDEHVFPKWVQNRFSLWNQRLTLLNGTKIPYRSLTIPCCFECNNRHLRPLEDRVCEATLKGHKAFVKLDELTLFLWFGKILYGLLYKELFLARDRKSGSKAKIVPRHLIKSFGLHHLFLQAARLPFKFLPAIPASIFIFHLSTPHDKQLQWDFRDCVPLLSISCRIGSVGILAALQDGRAQQDCLDVFWHRYQGTKLHPLQFTELTAAFFYTASLMNRVPKFMIVDESPTLVHVAQNPLMGFSLKPIFDKWNQEDYAHVLSQITGLPLADVFRPPTNVLSWLHDEYGRVKIHKIRGMNYGRFRAV